MELACCKQAQVLNTSLRASISIGQHDAHPMLTGACEAGDCAGAASGRASGKAAVGPGASALALIFASTLANNRAPSTRIRDITADAMQTGKQIVQQHSSFRRPEARDRSSRSNSRVPYVSCILGFKGSSAHMATHYFRGAALCCTALVRSNVQPAAQVNSPCQQPAVC